MYCISLTAVKLYRYVLQRHARKFYILCLLLGSRVIGYYITIGNANDGIQQPALEEKLYHA